MVMQSTDKNAEMLERYKERVAPTNARAFDIVAQRGHGSYLWDVDGERYLDFTSGIAVNNVGHCHPAVVAAVRAQVETLIHTSMVTCHTAVIELAEKLAEIAPAGLNSVFLNNSGGEAIDAALKFARFLTGRPNIISFTGAFHGRTLLATALTTAITAKATIRFQPRSIRLRIRIVIAVRSASSPALARWNVWTRWRSCSSIK
jgi:4-aminobutyrate aminotransferase